MTSRIYIYFLVPEFPSILSDGHQSYVERISNLLISQRKKMHFKGVKITFVSLLGIAINMLVILQMFNSSGNELLKNPWTGFGYLSKSSHERTDKLSIIFPAQFLCNFHRYDINGNLKKVTLNCILPKNEALELIYIYYWFLSLLNLTITIIDLLSGVILMFFPRFAIYIMNPADKWNAIFHLDHNDVLFKDLGWWESSGMISAFFELRRNLPRVTFSAIVTQMKVWEYHNLFD